MSVRMNAESLRQIPLFAECDPAHLQVMAFASERVQFAEKADIFRAGGTGSAAYLLLSGEAEVWRSQGEERLVVAVAGPGAFLGELAMIAGVAYSVNVTAKGPITATRITRDTFMRVVGEFPDFGTKVMSALSRKLTGSVTEFDRIRQMLENAPSFPRG
ncbi:Crp/Fnr family transcriptional regulator [Taklimakanibacter deserti]|uniref:Crp/Fnr family transcriptional regulator n=1 Tax=Taklimakanibacter deserti TaxID=2267839 RepID=UPI000E65A1FE